MYRFSDLKLRRRLLKRFILLLAISWICAGLCLFLQVKHNQTAEHASELVGQRFDLVFKSLSDLALLNNGIFEVLTTGNNEQSQLERLNSRAGKLRADADALEALQVARRETSCLVLDYIRTYLAGYDEELASSLEQGRFSGGLEYFSVKMLPAATAAQILQRKISKEFKSRLGTDLDFLSGRYVTYALGLWFVLSLLMAAAASYWSRTLQENCRTYLCRLIKALQQRSRRQRSLAAYIALNSLLSCRSSRQTENEFIGGVGRAADNKAQSAAPAAALTPVAIKELEALYSRLALKTALETVRAQHNAKALAKAAAELNARLKAGDLSPEELERIQASLRSCRDLSFDGLKSLEQAVRCHCSSEYSLIDLLSSLNGTAKDEYITREAFAESLKSTPQSALHGIDEAVAKELYTRLNGRQS